jgi:hypothetical protein
MGVGHHFGSRKMYRDTPEIMGVPLYVGRVINYRESLNILGGD